MLGLLILYRIKSIISILSKFAKMKALFIQKLLLCISPRTINRSVLTLHSLFLLPRCLCVSAFSIC